VVLDLKGGQSQVRLEQRDVVGREAAASASSMQLENTQQLGARR
jgi:hypothetical protein